jgi:hypothetical protein
MAVVGSLTAFHQSAQMPQRSERNMDKVTQAGSTSTIRRRGVLAGAAALAAAAVAKLTTPTANAADGGNLIIGANNISNATTQLTRNGPFGSTTAFFVDNNNYNAILGRTAGPGSAAIYAFALAGPDQALQANATAAGSYGLRVDAVDTAGLFVSQQGYGVAAIVNGNSAGYFKCNALAYALRVESTNVPGLAALFTGPPAAPGGPALVRIEGHFEATGTKSAVVPYPDGTQRRVYCTEAPDAWFEDYGEARLVDGRAVVPIPRDFAPLVDTSRYFVFLQPHDAETESLAVTSRLPDRFEVVEHGKGSSTASFTFRIVAKRKDVGAPRLAQVDRPQLGPPLKVDPPRMPTIPSN